MITKNLKKKNFKRSDIKIKKLSIILMILVLITVFTCQVFAEEKESSKSKEPIVFANADWPGIWAKHAVMRVILENIGYKTDVEFVGIPLAFQGLKQDEIDAYLGCWIPAQKEHLKSAQEENQVEVLGKNLTGALYTMAVPEYVWEAGVKYHKDLDKFADKFNHEIYVGASGWPISKKVDKAIKNDTYGLGDWTAINSSQSALMAHAKEAIRNKEWIVFPAWKPHWINHILDIKYLKESEKIFWEEPESYVNTVVRNEFNQEYPEVYKFLKQVKFEMDTVNEWIYKVAEEKIEEREMAREWVKNNLFTVIKWLKGVKALNGEPAIPALMENMFAEFYP